MKGIKLFSVPRSPFPVPRGHRATGDGRRIKRTSLAMLAGTTVLAGVLAQPSQSPPRFHDDDPLWFDPDNRPIDQPKPISELSQVYDFLENTLGDPGEQEERSAVNINTLGEVPDSSWFTNRHGRSRMSVAQLVRGPLQYDQAPEPTGVWTIIRAKTEGVTPGFWIRDTRGDIYNVKFDPKTNPEMATGAEAIVTRFFHALGYWVPENYLALCDPAKLEIAETAVLTDDDGKKRKMQRGDIDDILRRVPRLSDGRVRVIASRFLPGKPLGPFRYYGTRSDDANDVFPHELRRELRGMRVFAAWLNHDDSRSINSQDMYLEKERYVRHNLLDFGSTLGSGSVRQQTRRAGNEYMLEWETIAKKALSLGLYDRAWQSVRYPKDPAVGRFESSFFRPEKWRPEYPNAAFVRMDDEDAFWAARIVMRFSDEDIAALVATGQYSNSNSAAYLTRCLIERRDKIGRYYFGRITPLAEFEVHEGVLRFENLASLYGFAAAPSSYRYRRVRLDNSTGVLVALEEWKSGSQLRIDIPAELGQRYNFLRVDILPADAKAPVMVFVRARAGRVEVVGIER